MRHLSLLITTFVLISFNLFGAPPENLNEARDAYCVIPPFLQKDTYANVMLVIDSSGSMKSDAYKGSYNKNKIYKGIFKHDAYYACWNASHGYYYNYQTSCQPSWFDTKYWKIVKSNVSKPYKKYKKVSGVWATSGNYLNYLRMKRVDVIRWVLTGGYVETVSRPHGGSAKVVRFYYGQAIYYKDVTSYNPETDQVEGILQKIQRLKKRPRIGAYFFQNSSITKRVKPDYDYDSLIYAINTKSMYGATPTKYALKDTKRYFSRENGSHGGFPINSSTDPYKFEIDSGVVTVSCAKNFAILLTDGEWNTGGDPIGEAYNMWKGGTADLVSSLNGNQNAKLYSIALFLDDGPGKNAVQHLAIFGGYENRDSSEWPCAYSGLVYSKDPIQDITKPTYASCREEWDADYDALPDTFASGEDPEKVKNALEKVFRKILDEVASGSSVSMLSEKDKAGALLTQAVFYPQKTFADGSNEYRVKWIGELFSYWFLNTVKAQNIREDTNADKKLGILDDKILQFKISGTTGKLRIDICASDSDGKPTSSCSFTDKLEDLKYLWEAGEELKNRSPSDRTLYTVGQDNTLVEFNTANLSQIQHFLGTDSDFFPNCLVKSGGQIDYISLINYVKGQDISGCRSRVVDNSGNTWKLGDIIYSTPRLVKYNDYSVVFTASNDGILHAFKVGKLEKPSSKDYLAELTGTNLGKELWGFIPKNALPYLRFLADPEYCHLYIHDLSPFIFKADYDNDGTEELVLIGGMRLGGGCINSSTVNPPKDTCPNLGECFGLSAYYALDITNPTSPQFLWEFTDKDLGFSFSGPAIVKRQSLGDWNYFVIFASGPTDHKGFSNQKLHIFVLNLADGNVVLKKDMGSEFRNSFGGRLFTEGLDVNGDGQTDFVFLGYTGRQSDSSPWHGGVIKIWTGDSDPNNWEFNPNLLNLAKEPITTKVKTAQCFGRWYLFFGTGRYFFKEDVGNTTNYLYGVPFQCDENNNCSTATVNQAHSAGSVPCNKVGTMSQGAWKIQLDGSTSSYFPERNISDPSSLGDIAFFVTSQPTADVCGYGGRSRAWALNCALGEAVSSTRCPAYTVQNNDVIYIVQRTGGDITSYKGSDFTEEGGRATEYSQGLAPEEGGIPAQPSSALTKKGTILLWIEK